MSPTLATFVFELVNFLLLAGLLGWLLFKPVRTMLQERQAADKKRADELAACTAEADRLRAEWQQRNAAFEAEVTQARSARLAAAEQEAAAILARARAAADCERDRLAKTLAHVERAQFDRLAQAVASAAGEAVGRLLRALDAPDLEAGLVRAARRQMEALDGAALGAVLVESAKPLGDDERAALTSAVGTRATSLVFRVVPELGAGVRVTSARGLVDASLAGIAGEAGRRLEDALVADAPRSTT